MENPTPQRRRVVDSETRRVWRDLIQVVSPQPTAGRRRHDSLTELPLRDRDSRVSTIAECVVTMSGRRDACRPLAVTARATQTAADSKPPHPSRSPGRRTGGSWARRIDDAAVQQPAPRHLRYAIRPQSATSSGHRSSSLTGIPT
jgi:hypothetical protein